MFNQGDGALPVGLLTRMSPLSRSVWILIAVISSACLHSRVFQHTRCTLYFIGGKIIHSRPETLPGTVAVSCTIVFHFPMQPAPALVSLVGAFSLSFPRFDHLLKVGVLVCGYCETAGFSSFFNFEGSHHLGDMIIPFYLL